MPSNLPEPYMPPSDENNACWTKSVCTLNVAMHTPALAIGVMCVKLQPCDRDDATMRRIILVSVTAMTEQDSADSLIRCRWTRRFWGC